MKISKTTSILSFFIFFSFTNAQKSEMMKKEEITNVIERVIDSQKLVGTQSAIWYKGKMILDKSWGKSNISFDVPTHSDSRFLIASITKSFTGLAILQLINDKKIDIDLPIQHYIPEFPKKNGPNITIRLLLKNQSGVRHYYRDETTNASFFDTHYETALDAIEKFKNDPLLFEPGSGDQYSSFGYTLLAAIVEKVSGQPFSNYLNDHIFIKNDMSSTIVPDWRYPVPKLATSYSFFLAHLGVSEDNAFEARRLNFSYNAGGGNIVSTSMDLIKYGQIFLESNKSKASFIINNIKKEKSASFIYGWNIDKDINGRFIINATGASEAYQCSITIWPEHDLIIVALSNT